MGIASLCGGNGRRGGVADGSFYHLGHFKANNISECKE